MMDINVFPDLERLSSAAAELVAGLAAKAIAERGRFTVALAGGSTPEPLYARLAASPLAERVDWSRVLLLFGDERCVPPEDARSNFHLARTALLGHAPIPAANVYRMRGEDDPDQAAADYARVLERILGGQHSAGGPPAEGLDLVLLGMGDNGHTASLFPGLPAVTERTRWVMAQYVEVAGMWRITLTPVVLNAARNVLFLVAGEAKAEALERVLEGPYQPVVLPAQVVRPTHGQLQWLLDAAAAARLKRRP
jgi:6-phosphogluconolactonase